MGMVGDSSGILMTLARERHSDALADAPPHLTPFLPLRR